MKASKYLLGLVLISACSSGGGKDPNGAGNSATFVVDPVQASVESGGQNALYQNIATEKLFNFSACVKDVAVLEPIIGQGFRVADSARVVASVSTDSKGCLHWSERLPFNQLANETYVKITRTIEASGAHKGRQSVDLAINPWKNGSEAAIDLRFQAAPKLSDMGQAQKLTNSDSSLYVESVLAELEVQKNTPEGALAMLRLTMEPKTKRISLEGQTMLESLRGGKFQIKAQIVARASDSMAAVSPVSQAEGTSKEQQLRVEMPTKLVRAVGREQTIDLYLELTPMDAPEGLKPVRGIATLGRLTSVVVSGRPVFRPQEISFFELKSDGPNIASGGDGKTNDSHKGDELDFSVGRVSAERVLVTETDRNGRASKLSIVYKACLKNAISNEPILGRNFTLSMDAKEFPVRTDKDSGCITWQSDLAFSYFNTETYFKKEVSLQSRESFYGSSEKKFDLYLNPWQYEDAALFLIDERFGNPSTIANGGVRTNGVAGGRTGSELMLQGSWFTYIGRDFDVDSLLDLSIVRKYRIELRPVIRRMTVQGWKDEPIGNGKYYLRALVETQDGEEVVATSEQSVEASGDAILVTLPVKFRDLRQMQSRMRISLELTSFEKNSGLRSQAYMGYFEPVFQSTAGMQFQPRGSSIFSLVKKGAPKNALLGRPATLIYQQALKLQPVTTADFPGMSQAEMDSLLKSANPYQSKALSKLCGRYYSGFALRSCRNGPSSYLAVLQTDHVKKIRRWMKNGIDNSTLSVASNFSVSEYDSHDRTRGTSTTRSLKAEANFTGKISFLEFLGLSAGVGASISKSWYTAESNSEGRSRTHSTSVGQTKYLNVEEAKFTLQGDFLRCATIVAKEAANPKPEFLCASVADSKTVSETYYYVYQGVPTGPISDSGAAPSEKPLMLLIRGKERYRQFVSNLQRNASVLQLNKSSPLPGDLLRAAQNHYDGFFPGLLTPDEQ